MGSDAFIHDVLYDAGQSLNSLEAAARTLLVYVLAILIIRLGKKRFMAENTALDVIMAIMLGSVFSRCLTGSAHLGPTLAAAGSIIAVHWAFSWIALRSHRFGGLVKGSSHPLVVNGQIMWENMNRSHISERDLQEAIRAAGSEGVEDVRLAMLERSGGISVIPANLTSKVVDISVEEGVKTVRLELC